MVDLVETFADDGAEGITGQQDRPSLAIVHDYLATSGGAERVVTNLVRTFPDAPVYTSIFEPSKLFPELQEALGTVHTTRLSRVPFFRRHYRAAMPFLAATMRRFEVDADVVLCSSSGWSHGVKTSGRKVVYCYNPARWLYQAREYTDSRRTIASVAQIMRPYLLRYDRQSAHGCVRYIAISGAVAERIARAYNIEAEVVPPPTTLDPFGLREDVEGIEPGFVLCVARLVPYKNVANVVEAFRLMPEQRLVVVGDGPQLAELRTSSPSNVELVGYVSDEVLRWYYANCEALIAASFEDFGLTPVEAGLFGKPTACLRYGGFLDTMIEGETGLFFDESTPTLIAGTVNDLLDCRWRPREIRSHAARFGLAGFQDRMREIVAEEAALV